MHIFHKRDQIGQWSPLQNKLLLFNTPQQNKQASGIVPLDKLNRRLKVVVVEVRNGSEMLSGSRYEVVSTWNRLAQMTTTNRIISRQALIIIRSKRNTFIIRNQNKHKSDLYLVSKFRKLQGKLSSVAGRYNSRTLRVSRVF